MKPFSAAQVPDLINAKSPGQKWVFTFEFEPPFLKGAKMKSKQVETLAPGIDWTLTYLTSSDFAKPSFAMEDGPSLKEAKVARNWAKGKDKLLLWYTSNCHSMRLKIFNELKSHLPPGRVQVFGGCGTKDPCPRDRRRSRSDVTLQKYPCQEHVASRFKFYAAFENVRCDGYISEKLWTAFFYDMIPVVWGGLGRADYEKMVPGDSFIHVDDFESLAGLAQHILDLDVDDRRYSRYFAWKFRLHLRSGLDLAKSKYCDVCLEVRKPSKQQKPTKTFGNLSRWFYSSCLANSVYNHPVHNPVHNHPHVGRGGESTWWSKR